MNLNHHKILVLALALLFIPIWPAYPGEWRVSPIRLDFDKGIKSGVITISNDSAEKVHLQINEVEWTQDSEGKDKYVETSDLVYFPKIMILDKKKKRS